jgi:hypothetical protein
MPTPLIPPHPFAPPSLSFPITRLVRQGQGRVTHNDCIVTGVLFDINGTPLSDCVVSASPDRAFLRAREGDWQQIEDYIRRTFITGADGLWTLLLPWAEECDPVPIWTIRTPTRSLSGTVPSEAGPLLMRDLFHTYGWRRS